MEYIRVTRENLESEHICCAISNNRDIQVASKKAWLAERFDEGLVFVKSVERGKCFILNAKYVPIVEATARARGVPFKAVHLDSKASAQNAPTPVTTYALFCDGRYLTNEQMNDKRFIKLLSRS